MRLATRFEGWMKLRPIGFVNMVETNEVASPEMSAIPSRYFRDNSDVIWKEALQEHDLLNG